MSNIEKFSKTYGFVKYEMIGTVDFPKIIQNVEADVFFKWYNKYHYRKFFPTSYVEKIPNTEISLANQELATYNIFVPTDDINHDWNPEHWYNNNPTIKRTKQRKLPISVSRKNVVIWQKKLTSIYNLINKD